MKSYLKGAFAALGLLSAAGTAQAAIFTIDFTTAGAFSGTAPSSPSPTTVFATATFDDQGGTGSVTLTMNVFNNLSAGAYVNDWYFNVAQAPLSGITFVSGIEATGTPTPVENGKDAFKADGTGGNFDFAFHFTTTNPGELAQGKTSVYTLTGTGITADSFNALSVSAPPTAGNGGYVSALHVQGYGNSVWISGEGSSPSTEIPEPGTLALLGLGLFGIAAARRQKR
ncbi:MAG: PEP-CTERM sorting domain-containing protein [Nitrosospira multiformis]|nr:PEP-CTERM sorting domain-containing protein [Nitrosospira multiformis]